MALARCARTIYDEYVGGPRAMLQRFARKVAAKAPSRVGYASNDLTSNVRTALTISMCICICIIYVSDA
jgi:hypothetical protein